MTLPAAAYTDVAQYERERHAVFGRQWQLAAFAAALRAPGDYVRHEFAGWSVVVVVDNAGALRAFHNVCRHRAGPLVDEDAGRCSSFVCRYHGWAYDLDGSLLSARDFGDEALDLDEFPLHEVQVASWRGLVFVNLDAEMPPLDTDHGAFFAAMADQPLEEFSYSHRVVHPVDANWKVYTDNYGEGYHVPLVHPELNRELVAREYRVEVGDHFSLHTAPTRSGAVNAGRWLWRYPNLALNIYPNGMNVERFIPAGPRRTLVVYDYFFRTDDPENADVERMGREVLAEDRAICEAVQRNLEAGVYDTGVLSPRHENGLVAFHEWLAASLADVH